MNETLWKQIKKAAEDSLKNPGKNKKPLPKNESPTDPEIYVFRHGETTDNINRIFSGWRDANLTKRGEQQAEVLALKLKNKHIDLCITSTQIRSKATAEIALKYHKEIVFEEDPRIMERNYGELQGKSKERAMKENPEQAIKWRRGYDNPPPGGESLQMVEQRVFPFCEELVERIKKNNINVAISCHGNSMRAIRRYFEGLSVAKEATVENPLGTDYAEYVVKVPKNRKSAYQYSKEFLKKLVIPNYSYFR